ncbi:hypothetical protein CFIO01_13292 [Colletotrichum fioriniae PJ7]|uniref:Uncharacterized protein n=1 Tax=Colletotrichum fioriniae PJ7 TaxID=1445577 RepID=A0A010RF61_9PEZI|nr:hypothetical protein CFIO01_13292 [Colletotrichum fioriniae PJ7]
MMPISSLCTPVTLFLQSVSFFQPDRYPLRRDQGIVPQEISTARSSIRRMPYRQSKTWGDRSRRATLQQFSIVMPSYMASFNKFKGPIRAWTSWPRTAAIQVRDGAMTLIAVPAPPYEKSERARTASICIPDRYRKRLLMFGLRKLRVVNHLNHLMGRAPDYCLSVDHLTNPENLLFVSFSRPPPNILTEDENTFLSKEERKKGLADRRARQRIGRLWCRSSARFAVDTQRPSPATRSGSKPSHLMEKSKNPSRKGHNAPDSNAPSSLSDTPVWFGPGGGSPAHTETHSTSQILAAQPSPAQGSQPILSHPDSWQKTQRAVFPSVLWPRPRRVPVLGPSSCTLCCKELPCRRAVHKFATPQQALPGSGPPFEGKSIATVADGKKRKTRASPQLGLSASGALTRSGGDWHRRQRKAPTPEPQGTAQFPTLRSNAVLKGFPWFDAGAADEPQPTEASWNKTNWLDVDLADYS